jgi:hypothetical protein
LHFKSLAVIWISGGGQCHMKIHGRILVSDEVARRQQFLNAFHTFSYSCSRDVSSNMFRKRIMSRCKFILSWLNIWGQRILISYPDVSYSVRQFRMARESVEDSRRNVRPPDFQIHFRIEGALEASLNASVWDIVQTTGIAPSIVFSVLTQVLIWNSIAGDEPPRIERQSETNNSTTCCFASSGTWWAQRRNWMEFYTSDESRALWKNFSKQCWLSLDEALPEWVHSTIRAEKSRVVLFANANCLVFVDFLPQTDSFTVQYFID